MLAWEMPKLKLSSAIDPLQQRACLSTRPRQGVLHNRHQGHLAVRDTH
jgi:hypothetical protein